MTPERWKKVEEIFNAAVEKSAQERAVFLSETCGEDSPLRAEVERLLALDQEAGDFIESPVAVSQITHLVEFPFTDQTFTLIGQQLGAYQLEREIGRGGMGAVYLATRADNEFSKRVAIKLVKRGMDTDFIIRRFRNERQILANLDHPNIARLLDGGTTRDGLPYFVMEYIEGLPLTRYCDLHRLSVVERLKLFVQICAAVHYAHQQFVIHRDIKPGNILVTGDNNPKLLDFGIAKILNEDSLQDPLDNTATAMRLMTPVYASPEQARGELVTHASDQYSLGVLLYELLTGHRPYKLRNQFPHEIAVIICEVQPEKPSLAIRRVEEVITQDGKEALITPEQISYNRSTSLAELERALAAGLDDIVMQALSKEIAQRYASVEKFAEDIQQYLAGLPISAPVYSSTARTRAYQDSLEDSQSSHNSIAILPLKLLNFSEEEDTGGNFLQIGLADALITRLSNVRSLTVRPTASVLKYSREESDPLAAGRELNVNYVLDGRILKAGERIRVTVQLINIKTAAPQWAAQFDEKYTDILELQDSISEQLVQAITQRLTGEERQQMAKRGTNNIAAYEAYLRGRHHWNTYTEAGLARAITCFYEAIALDENFAAAYSGVADYHAWLGMTSVLPPEECFLAAKDAASRALALDDKLAEAYASLGIATWAYDWDFQESERLLKQALALNNNYAQAHEWYAYVCASQDRYDEAVASMNRALQIDPLSPSLLTMMSFILYNAGEFAGAATAIERALELDPNYYIALQAGGWTYTALGETAKAIAMARKGVEISGRTSITLWSLTCTLFLAGEKEEARKVLDELLEMAERRYIPAYYFTVIYTIFGDFDKAFEYLEMAFEQRIFWIFWLPKGPQLQPLREDQRFPGYLKRLQAACCKPAREKGVETAAVGKPHTPGDALYSAATREVKVKKETREKPRLAGLHTGDAPRTMELAPDTLSLEESAKAKKPSSKSNGLAGSQPPEESAIEADAVTSRRPANQLWFLAGLLLLTALVTLLVFKWSDWFGSSGGVGDGAYPLRLTQNPGDDQFARVSPDGRRIAFSSNRDGKPEIYVMNADGSGTPQRLTFNTVEDKAPSWSPDGRRIAFDNVRVTGVESDIYVMDADGSNQINLSNAQGYDSRAAWSPDGRRIAFASNRGGGATAFDIYVMNADGSNVTRLTSDPEFEVDPNWSPDGSRIAFTRMTRQGSFEIFVMNADGSNAINLSNNPASDGAPLWSPDGRLIAFSSARATSNRAAEDIYVMNADGSNPRRVTNNSANDIETSWMPDSRRLVFQSNRDGNYELYLTDIENNQEINPALAGGAGGEKKTIAVLPFKTEGANELDASLGVGLADVLTSKLGQIKQLAVRPAAAARRFTDPQNRVREIGQELQVGYVLSGSLSNAVDRVQVTSQLISVSDGRILWAEKFDEPVGDISALQSSIAARVVKALTLELTPFEMQQLGKRNTENSEAYQLYLVGRYQWSKRTANGLHEAIRNFEQAIKRDPKFALAYAGLADCYAMLNLYQDMSPSLAFPKAKENALKALQFDDQLAEAQASLAYVTFYYDRNRPQAEREFRRAIELNPSYSTAHHWFALVLSAMGRAEEALSEIKIAQQLDPRSAIIYSAVGTIYFYNRQYELAVEQGNKALEIDPGLVPAHRLLRWTYGVMKRYEDAYRSYISEKGYSGDSEFEWPVIVAQLEAIGGKPDEARAALQRGFASPAFKSGANYMYYEIAVIYALLNDQEQALKWLTTADTNKTYLFNFAEVDPRFDNLRQEPRFQALVKKLTAPQG
jgi:eukaryotic-like serine/threonine-protein kinase